MGQYADTLAADRKYLRALRIRRRWPQGGRGSARSAPGLGAALHFPPAQGPAGASGQEAQASVLAPYAGASRHRLTGPPGSRGPAGPGRLTTSSSAGSREGDRMETERDFYDSPALGRKALGDIGSLDELGLTEYVRACGGSCNPGPCGPVTGVGIAGYLGKNWASTGRSPISASATRSGRTGKTSRRSPPDRGRKDRRTRDLIPAANLRSCCRSPSLLPAADPCPAGPRPGSGQCRCLGGAAKRWTTCDQPQRLRQFLLRMPKGTLHLHPPPARFTRRR